MNSKFLFFVTVVEPIKSRRSKKKERRKLLRQKHRHGDLDDDKNAGLLLPTSDTVLDEELVSLLLHVSLYSNHSCLIWLTVWVERYWFVNAVWCLILTFFMITMNWIMIRISLAEYHFVVTISWDTFRLHNILVISSVHVVKHSAQPQFLL